MFLHSTYILTVLCVNGCHGIRNLQHRPHHLCTSKTTQKPVFFPVCTPKATFNTSKVSGVFFPSLKQNFMQIHKSTTFSVHQNHKWTTNTCTKQDISQQSFVPQHASKQEMPQQILLYLHLAAGMHARSSTVILWLVWKLSYSTMYFAMTWSTNKLVIIKA